MITHLAKETGQQKEQCGWGLQVTGKWRGGGNWTKFEKRGGGIGNISVAPFCQLCKEALKISHPPMSSGGQSYFMGRSYLFSLRWLPLLVMVSQYKCLMG